MARTDRNWRIWSEIDPYYGVLTHDEFRRENIEGNKDQFFQTGEQDIDIRLAGIERHFGPIARGRALDFGCGVGRMLVPLGQRFDEAVGVDIAPAMLAEARVNAERVGLGNLTLVESDDGLTRVTGSFDFVNTFIVLQHMPVPRGLAVIERLLDLVRPGGGVSLHFSIDRREGLLSAGRYWAQRHLPGLQEAINLTRGRKWNHPLMEMNAYPFSRVSKLLMDRGFATFMVEPQEHGRFLTLNILSRRSGGKSTAA